MGAITRTIGESAKERGATIVHNATVSSILYEPNPAKGNAKVKGVKMADGTELYAKTGMRTQGACLT
jgi:phytoene dehydrogenase-like protein